MREEDKNRLEIESTSLDTLLECDKVDINLNNKVHFITIFAISVVEYNIREVKD